MAQISQVAENKGLSSVGLTEKIKNMNQKYQLPIAYQPWETEKFYAAITHDKKARGSHLNIVLLEEIGKAYIQNIKLSEIKDFLLEGK